jgi:hypothetical protein
VALGRDAMPVSGGPPRLGTMVFRSDDADIVLAIDLDPLSAEVGLFAVTVGGVGSYLGTDRAIIEPNGVRNVKARYEGPVRVVPLGAAPRTSIGRLSGEFLTDKGRAVATLEVDGRKYRISTHGVPAEDVTTVLPAFEAALRSSDWDSLYALLAADLRRGISAADFAASATAQTLVVGRTADLRRLTVGAPTASPLGMSYALAIYEIDRTRADGSRTTTAYEAYFLYEGGWRLWFTASR